MSVYPTTHASRRAAFATCSTVVAALAFSGVASATSPTVSKVDGNPRCSDVSSGLHSIKIDPVPQGNTNWGRGGLSGQMSVSGRVLDWTSNQPISVVIVKGGPNANIYRYNPAATGGQGLHAPVNPKNGQFYGLSHVDFCTGSTPPPPPPPGPCEEGGPTTKPNGEPCTPPGPCEQGGPTTKPNGEPCTPPGPCEEGGPATRSDGSPCTPPGPCEAGGPTMRPDGSSCTPPEQEVAGVTESGTPRVRASARLRQARRCVGGPFTQVLRGRGIRRVTVTVNGKSVGQMRRSGRRYSIRINPRGFDSRVLKVRARVTFVAASGARPRTLRTTVLRCAGRAPAVRFTG
jgi:hypothetical protein